METTVSVIVPYYRGENYLKDCLDSLKAQNYEAMEIILVGDGCGNEAEELIKQYDGLNIRFCRTEAESGQPQGVAIARNIGIDMARGKYILFVDSDDYLLDGCLQNMVNMAEENPNAMVRARKNKTWYKRESGLEEYAKKLQQALENQETQDDADDEDLDEDGTDGADGGAEKNQNGDGDNTDISEEMQLPTIKYSYGTSTALGILMPTRLVQNRYVRFSPGFKYYCDLPFMCELCEMLPITKCREAVYFKRNHNDAVRMPSLSQEESSSRLGEFVESFNAAWDSAREYLADGDASEYVPLEEKIPSNEPVTGSRIYKKHVAFYLEKYICRYLIRNLTKKKHPKGLNWTPGELGSFSEFVKEVRKDILKGYRFKKRRILKKIGKGKNKGALRAAKFFVMNKKKKGLFGTPLQWKWNIYKRIFRKMSVRKDFYLFESFLGKTYGDSPRYIYEYMRKRDDERQIDSRKYIWIIDNKAAEIPGKHIQVKPKSLKYFYYVARAGVWVNNMRQPSWYEKRNDVRFLETWHGTPLKKLVFDMDDVHSASPKYKMTFYKQSRIWDYLISDNAFSTDCFESAFLYPREKMLELGYPRNDLLYGESKDERAAAIREKLGIPKDKKVVLYAPTWRDDDYYGPGQYKFDLPLDLKMMRKLKNDYFFVLRTHYFIADHLQIDDSDKDFVMDLSRYNDIGELYLISDILITDYSSVFFDFANLRRPILFYVYDLEKYAGMLRGFYFDMTTGCPGPLLKTNEEVLNALENIESVSREYADKYKEFCDKFCYLDDGHASERIVKEVFPEIEGNN